MVRHNNQLPDNLPQLQNLIKRDPEAYKDDFLQQHRHFLSILEVFQLTPDEPNKSLDELIMFIAQVAQCYPEELVTFPQQIVDILKSKATTLDPGMRNTFCKALILLRNKNLIPALDLLELFFQLLRCPDKSLRTFLENHIVADIKNMNANHKDMKLNATLQNFMYSMLNDTFPKAAKMSVDIMIELYRKNIWNDSKTVNVIGTVGCFSKFTKVQVAALQFFLGSDDTETKDSDDSDSEPAPDLKQALMSNRVNKKSKKRKKQLKVIKKQVVKTQKKNLAPPSFNYSAIHLIHNPQGMAEGLFKQLQSGNERFEVKLMHLDVISRLIGLHDLFLFSFYPYITRFLQPHQRQVTRVMQFAAQASHELIPGDVIEPVIKTILHNFITERNSSDVMAIGLNAVREICARCPLAMSEDLLTDLALYKTYKDKSVKMAAKTLITLYREQLPQLLRKKDRGRPSQHSVEIKHKKYGEVLPYDHIPGAEALLEEAPDIDMDEDESDCSDDDNDDGWVDIEQKDDGNSAGEDDVDSFDEDEEEVDDDVDEDDNDVVEDENNKDVKTKKETKGATMLNEKEAAQELASTKIFTDADFVRIDLQKIKKQVTGFRKRPLEIEKTEFVKLDDIELIHKKRKHDRQTKIDSANKGRIDRDKFGHRDKRSDIHCSKTNREKRKNKNFQMLRQKARGKIKKSFRDKQIALRNHLTKQKKMK